MLRPNKNKRVGCILPCTHKRRLFFVCTWRHNVTWVLSWLTLRSLFWAITEHKLNQFSICWCILELLIMTNLLSTFVKCVCVKFLCCCARVLQCQPRWRPIANHLYEQILCDVFLWQIHLLVWMIQQIIFYLYAKTLTFDGHNTHTQNKARVLSLICHIYKLESQFFGK